MAWRWAGLYFLLLMLLVEALHGEGRGSVKTLMSFDTNPGQPASQQLSVTTRSWPDRQPGRAGRQVKEVHCWAHGLG